MTQPSLMTMIRALGVAVASLGLAMPASAVVLTQTSPTPSWTNLGWKVEGRAGASGGADYELAIGPNGAASDLTGQAEWTWNNGEEVPWSLNWNGQTASFTFGNLSPILYSLSAPSNNVFNGFYLLTKTITENNKVARRTEMNLNVKTVNGTDVTAQNVFSSSRAPTSGFDLDQPFFSSSEAIATLTGTANMSWLTLNPQAARARSRVNFSIRGYNTGAIATLSAPPVLQSAVGIPEPTATLGLLALGMFGVGSVQKRQKNL